MTMLSREERKMARIIASIELMEKRQASNGTVRRHRKHKSSSSVSDVALSPRKQLSDPSEENNSQKSQSFIMKLRSQKGTSEEISSGTDKVKQESPSSRTRIMQLSRSETTKATKHQEEVASKRRLGTRTRRLSSRHHLGTIRKRPITRNESERYLPPKKRWLVQSRDEYLIAVNEKEKQEIIQRMVDAAEQLKTKMNRKRQRNSLDWVEFTKSEEKSLLKQCQNQIAMERDAMECQAKSTTRESSICHSMVSEDRHQQHQQEQPYHQEANNSHEENDLDNEEDEDELNFEEKNECSLESTPETPATDREASETPSDATSSPVQLSKSSKQLKQDSEEIRERSLTRTKESFHLLDDNNRQQLSMVSMDGVELGEISSIEEPLESSSHSPLPKYSERSNLLVRKELESPDIKVNSGNNRQQHDVNEVSTNLESDGWLPSSDLEECARREICFVIDEIIRKIGDSDPIVHMENQQKVSVLRGKKRRSMWDVGDPRIGGATPKWTHISTKKWYGENHNNNNNNNISHRPLSRPPLQYRGGYVDRRSNEQYHRHTTRNNNWDVRNPTLPKRDNWMNKRGDRNLNNHHNNHNHNNYFWKGRSSRDRFKIRGRNEFD